MTRDHLEQVMEIERASFPTPWTTSMFLYELTSPLSFHFVASKRENRSDIVLCYIIFWMFRGEVHILNLATHSAFRKLGIAHSLLLFTLDFCYRRGGILYLLEVRKGNRTAINLYQKVGFASWGFRKKYYADTGEDAIIMGLFYGDQAYGTKGDEQTLLP
ncbi:MAG: ribosomal-protein-alanine N-acetyltransferase [Deltaproteobacteria bacterium RBG_13_52_11]|nr:MAG: ribosomal-protein-alanine N-acetyltransferase [Deltaproteobacteria bacterium RBG_13_52_11]